MKLSEQWLREWVNPAIDSNTLSEQLTMIGLEVDSLEKVANLFTGVKIGRLVMCQKHPKAPALWVTKVDIGSNRLLNILCNADNCRTDLRVAVAPIGTVLSEMFKFKTLNLFDEFSEGILCSFSELGILDDHIGIIELPRDAPIGNDLYEYLQLDDKSINISVTLNRGDCLGILGVARDLAALNKLPLQQPVIESIVPLISDTLPIKVEANSACPRYLARIVKNIDISVTTPLWMKEKLRRCGMHSVNVVVDISNYVMLELGQSMHVFDLNRIDGGIIIRMAKQDEPLVLLDDRKIKLNSDTLVIADEKKALSLAGIFGGAFSKINPTTKNILLECAFFNPLAVIGRARHYGLHTEAAQRYERGVDPALQENVMERATAMFLAICGGLPGPVTNITDKEELPQSKFIVLRRTKLDRLIGHVIPDQEVTDILIRLGFTLNQVPDGWQIMPPSWRFDIDVEEDLVEEVIRIYGYKNIPNIPIHTTLKIPLHREDVLPLERVKTLLVDRGYQEAITYSFVDPKIQNLLHPGEDVLVLPNPISMEMSVMRLSLWSGLISTVLYNQNRQQQRIRLFECGLRFVPDNSAYLGVRQDYMLSGIITGTRFDQHWDLTPQSVDFYDLKGDLEAIFELTGKLNQIKFRVQTSPALHPGQSAVIDLKGEAIGLIGLIHPELEKKLKLNSNTLVFDLLWEKIAVHTVPKVIEISRFPVNRRDISVVVAEEIDAEDIITECKKISKNQLVEVNLFDVYRGKGIPKGFKSLALSLILQGTVRTLEEVEIVSIVAKCVAALKQRFKVSLRD